MQVYATPRRLAVFVENLTESTRRGVGDSTLGAGEKRHLARDSHERVTRVDRCDDVLRSGEIDAEGLLSEEVDAGLRNGDVQLLVQVVRHSQVQHVDVVTSDELTPVLGECLDSRDAAEPLTGGRVRVSDGNNAWSRGMINELRPTSADDSQFAAHQSTADDPDADGTRSHDAPARIAPAAAASAPSCSMAISARVMPPGLSCWMMLRP